MRIRSTEERAQFIKSKYITCKKCGYNNEKKRFLQFGVCLKCGNILDEKIFFLIEMNKKLNNNKRKSG